MTSPTPNAMPQQTQPGTGGTSESGQQQQDPSGGGQQPQFDPNAPSISQSHMNHLLAEQKRELHSKFGDYDTLKDKAERYDTLVGTAKSAEEQASDLAAQLATREREVADERARALRYKLAGEAQIPAPLWDMVGGGDETTIKHNIELLKQHTTTSGAGGGTIPPAQGGQQPQHQSATQRPAPVRGQGQPGAGSSGGLTGNGMAGGRELFKSRQKSKGKQDA